MGVSVPGRGARAGVGVATGRVLPVRPLPPAASVLDTGLLLRAYAAGLFPMADSRDADDIFWVEPRMRGILPVDHFHLPRSVLKLLRQERFLHSRDLAFDAVVRHCASAAAGREQSWINATIHDAALRLHREGHAHSIEVWDNDGNLAGGLYGIRIGGAFFGESMFSRKRDASKVALVHLVVRLRLGGFRLIDTQFVTPHLARFGGREIRRDRYLDLLEDAVERTADWGRLDEMAGIAPQPGLRAALDGSLAATGFASPPDLAAPGFAAAPLAVPVDLLAGAGPSGTYIVQLLSQTS